jgi:hypothetical protein
LKVATKVLSSSSPPPPPPRHVEAFSSAYAAANPDEAVIAPDRRMIELTRAFIDGDANSGGAEKLFTTEVIFITQCNN